MATMVYANPGWTNGSPPALNKTNLDLLSNALASIGSAGSASVRDSDKVAGTTPGARGLTALASASTLDADTVTAIGLGTVNAPSMASDWNNYTSGGIYKDTGNLTNNPFGGAAWCLVIPYNAAICAQVAFDAGVKNNLKFRVNLAGWGAWQTIFTSSTGTPTGTDGNGGQPPAPKPSGNDGNLTTIGSSTLASVPTGPWTMPGTTGSGFWLILSPSNANISGVQCGRAGCGTGVGNMNNGLAYVFVWRVA